MQLFIRRKYRYSRRVIVFVPLRSTYPSPAMPSKVSMLPSAENYSAKLRCPLAIPFAALYGLAVGFLNKFVANT